MSAKGRFILAVLRFGQGQLLFRGALARKRVTFGWTRESEQARVDSLPLRRQPALTS
jgi:hypothetical protein